MIRRLQTFALTLTLAAIPVRALAYQANCGAGSFTATSLSSVFGEPRPDVSPADQSIPFRFHAGVDIGNNCSAQANVYAIESGTASMVNAYCKSGTTNCVRIKGPNGHSFDYEHVLWSGVISPGQFVTAGTALGPLEPNITLHLNDIVSVGPTNIRVNPQFLGRLDFNDSDNPQFNTATIGTASNLQVILAPHTSPPNPQPFIYRNLRFYVQGNVDIFVTALDGPGARKGVYRMGTNAYPIISPTFSSPGSGYQNISLSALKDGASDPSDVQTVYWRIQGTPASGSETYIPSAQFTGPVTPQAAATWWATDYDAEGNYNLCARIEDNPKQAKIANTSPCQGVFIDRTPPTITLSAGGSNFTVATATPIVTVTGDDTGGSGIYSITLTGVSYSSTNYVSGVQTAASNQFPDSGNLADGSYTATVQDLAGNQTSVKWVFSKLSG